MSINSFFNIERGISLGIRSTAKAVIINNGKILLNKCSDKNNGDYYALPGGGQQKYETLYEAVIRECREETGYEVKPLKLLGICEVICLDEEIREKYSDYAHKMYHIFLCELINGIFEIPTEQDSMQIGIEWLDINTLDNIRLFPNDFGKQVSDILNGIAPIFLGSEYIKHNHG